MLKRLVCPHCGYTHEEFILKLKGELKLFKTFKCQNGKCKKWWLIIIKGKDDKIYFENEELTKEDYIHLISKVLKYEKKEEGREKGKTF